MNWQDTPIYIINRNNLERGFRKQVDWLLDAGMTNVNVVDNASTYPPLLKYYDIVKINVIKKDKNYGPYVFWDTGLHETQETKYIVSDADVVPDKDCPKDLVKRMLDVFDKLSHCALKVGTGIRIDNIPDHYINKQKVISHEEQFWRHPVKDVEGLDGVFEALIDTTFAMYWDKSAFPGWHHHFRLDFPYVIEHTPWYENSSESLDEHNYYRAHMENGWSCWENEEWIKSR